MDFIVFNYFCFKVRVKQVAQFGPVKPDGH
jgi:hypothetical protein